MLLYIPGKRGILSKQIQLVRLNHSDRTRQIALTPHSLKLLARVVIAASEFSGDIYLKIRISDNGISYNVLRVCDAAPRPKGPRGRCGAAARRSAAAPEAPASGADAHTRCYTQLRVFSVLILFRYES